MAFDKKTFARDLKTKRVIDKSLSLTGLSKEINIHRSLIHSLETGTTTPDVEVFETICKWLNEEPKKYLK